jgi:hypothetical protein
VQQSNQLSSSRQALGLPELRLRVASLYQSAITAYDLAFNKFPSDHQFYQHQTYAMLQNDLALNKFKIACNDFLSMIDQLGGIDGRRASSILELPNKNLVIATNDLNTWLQETSKRIVSMRQSLH